MSDIASALANVDLGDFEGSPILSTAIDCPNIGGGFGMALEIDPVIMHKGQRVQILVDAEVVQIAFPPVKDTNGVKRLHRLSAVTATFVEGSVFSEALDAQRTKIERAKESAAGVSRLPLPEELTIQHGEGAHAAGLVEGCPVCDTEVEREAAGD